MFGLCSRRRRRYRRAHRLHTKPASIPAWDASLVKDSDEDVVISHNWDELRRFMWDYVGIVRTNKRLLRAKHRVRLLREEIHEFYANYRVSHNLLELRNLVDVADVIIRAAPCCAKRAEACTLAATTHKPCRAPLIR